MKLIKREDGIRICVCQEPTWWEPQQEAAWRSSRRTLMCPCCGAAFCEFAKSHPHVTRFGDGTVPEERR